MAIQTKQFSDSLIRRVLLFNKWIIIQLYNTLNSTPLVGLLNDNTNLYK